MHLSAFLNSYLLLVFFPCRHAWAYPLANTITGTVVPTFVVTEQPTLQTSSSAVRSSSTTSSKAPSSTAVTSAAVTSSKTSSSAPQISSTSTSKPAATTQAPTTSIWKEPSSSSQAQWTQNDPATTWNQWSSSQAQWSAPPSQFTSYVVETATLQYPGGIATTASAPSSTATTGGKSPDSDQDKQKEWTWNGIKKGELVGIVVSIAGVIVAITGIIVAKLRGCCCWS